MASATSGLEESGSCDASFALKQGLGLEAAELGDDDVNSPHAGSVTGRDQLE
jgi:hypothetical protein